MPRNLESIFLNGLKDWEKSQKELLRLSIINDSPEQIKDSYRETISQILDSIEKEEKRLNRVANG